MWTSSTERNVKSIRTFFGTVYDASGAHPDPKKVDEWLHTFHLHPITSHIHHPTTRTAEKGLRVHVEHNLTGSLQPDQAIGLQGHHTPVFQCLETHHCQSWCIKEGTWSHTPAGWASSCLCFQSSYPYRTVLCQHRTSDISLQLQSWMISHQCIWLCLHYREWPQTPKADQPEDPCWYPSLTSIDAAQTAELWCHHQVSPSRRCCWSTA